MKIVDSLYVCGVCVVCTYLQLHFASSFIVVFYLNFTHYGHSPSFDVCLNGTTERNIINKQTKLTNLTWCLRKKKSHLKCFFYLNLEGKVCQYLSNVNLFKRLHNFRLYCRSNVDDNDVSLIYIGKSFIIMYVFETRCWLARLSVCVN